MRCNTKALYRKFNQLRKQNWSAPTIMSVFIIICMGCIFSLESLGLLNKEKNLNYRSAVSPETKIILTNSEKNFSTEEEITTNTFKDKISRSISKDKRRNSNSTSDEYDDNLLLLPDLSEEAAMILKKRNSDEKINLINNILLEAAQAQIQSEEDNDIELENGDSIYTDAAINTLSQFEQNTNNKFETDNSQANALFEDYELLDNDSFITDL